MIRRTLFPLTLLERRKMTNKKITFEFQLSDLPMLADAMMIAGNTAMLCSNPVAQKRCDEIRNMIAEHIPAAALLMDGEEWVEIMACLNKSSKWNVYLSGNRWSYARYYTIAIDDKTWKSKRWADKDTNTVALIEGLIEVLYEMAPLTTEMDTTLTEEKE